MNGDEIALKNFYNKLLNSTLTKKEARIVVRSYIDLNSPELVLLNLKQIDKQMEGDELNSVLGLKLELVMKSMELKKIYLPSLIKMLKDNPQRSDLDATFFIIMKNNGFKHLKDSSSRSQVKSYLDYIAPKYSVDINWKSDDPDFMFAKKYFNDLKGNI
ncbi:MAG: hypothetical protein P4M14_02115 [Gammaproteobacteria bacterium]|nr:hypothetical protein [Gammaproteobacteria bacterium]